MLRKNIFPVLFIILKNKTVLQETGVTMDGRVISSKSALAICSMKWRNYDPFFFFFWWGGGVSRAIEVGGWGLSFWLNKMFL